MDFCFQEHMLSHNIRHCLVTPKQFYIKQRVNTKKKQNKEINFTVERKVHNAFDI